MRRTSIPAIVALLQQLDELDTQVDPLGLEVQKVQPTSISLRFRLRGEIDQFREGSSDLARMTSLLVETRRKRLQKAEKKTGKGPEDKRREERAQIDKRKEKKILTSTATWLTRLV
jgi:hypothetical protein